MLGQGKPREFHAGGSLHPMWAMTHRPGQTKPAGNGPSKRGVLFRQP
jgi:hypothetical protein